MIVYVYGKCSTCKTALRSLKERGVAFHVKEITQEPPSIAELHQMLEYQKTALSY